MPDIKDETAFLNDSGQQRPDSGPGVSSSHASGDRSVADYLLLAFVGIPGIALLMVLFGWLVLPMLLLPAMYVMGLGVAARTIVGAIAGICWMAALTTWLKPKNLLQVVGGAAVGAFAFHLTGVLSDFLGPWTPAYGAIATASLVSCVLEHPASRPRLLLVAGLLGGIAGAILGSQLPEDAPRAALWITAVAVHGVIAVSSLRRWTFRSR